MEWIWTNLHHWPFPTKTETFSKTWYYIYFIYKYLLYYLCGLGLIKRGNNAIASSKNILVCWVYSLVIKLQWNVWITTSKRKLKICPLSLIWRCNLPVVQYHRFKYFEIKVLFWDKVSQNLLIFKSVTHQRLYSFIY